MEVFDESDLIASFKDGFNKARKRYEHKIEAYKIANAYLKQENEELRGLLEEAEAYLPTPLFNKVRKALKQK